MQEDARQNYAMPGIMWAGGVEHMQGLDAMVLSPRPTCHSLAMMRKRDLNLLKSYSQMQFNAFSLCSDHHPPCVSPLPSPPALGQHANYTTVHSQL